jgi:hypothetical protein
MKTFRKVALTFDVDFVNSAFDREFYNEMEEFAPKILSELKAMNIYRSTWFLSIDKRAEMITGDQCFALERNRDFIFDLKEMGGTIGWHFHPYAQDISGRWIKPTSNSFRLEDLSKYASIARKYGIEISRFGWGFFSDAVLEIIIEKGFSIDSSCIPRPNYTWASPLGDWSKCTNEIFYPSRGDYQVNDETRSTLKEIPISTAIHEKVTDTEEGVVRYLNISDSHDVFKSMLDKIHNNHIVIISHPYEFFSQNPGGRWVFQNLNFKNNLELLQMHNFDFVNMEDL